MIQEKDTDDLFFIFNLLLDHFYHPESLIKNKNEKNEILNLGRDFFLINLIGFLNGLKKSEEDDDKENSGLCTMKQISKFLQISDGTATGRIDKLVNQNLVVRSIGEKDRRYITLNLTKKGNQIYEKLKSGRISHIKWILSHLTEEENKNFMKIIKTFSKLAFDHFEINS